MTKSMTDDTAPMTDDTASSAAEDRKTGGPKGGDAQRKAGSPEKISGEPPLNADRTLEDTRNSQQEPGAEEAKAEEDRPRPPRTTANQDYRETGGQTFRELTNIPGSPTDKRSDDSIRRGGRPEEETPGGGGHQRNGALRSTRSGTDGGSTPPKTPIQESEAGKRPVSKSHDGGYKVGFGEENKGNGQHDKDGASEEGKSEERVQDEVVQDEVEKQGDEESGGGDRKPRGTLQGGVLGTKAELRAIEKAVGRAYDAAPEGYRKYKPVGRRILVHVYFCETRFATWNSSEDDSRGGGIPIGYRLIQQACQDVGLPIPSSTEDVWAPLREADLLVVDRYIRREGSPGRSRRFRLSRSLLGRLNKGAEEGMDKKSRYDLMTGRRIRETEKTELTYDGTHSWEDRSELIYRALKALRGQRDLINKEAVQEHINRLKAKQERLKARYETKKDAYIGLLEKCCTESEGGEWDLKDGVDAETRAELDRLQEAAVEAWQAYRKAWSRHQQDLRIWTKIRHQGLEPAPDQPPGIYQYETAYGVQEASGRLTMTAGLQNASSEMKAAAAKGISGYHNYDIKSSQTEALRQELRMASEMEIDPNISGGPEVTPDALEDYPGKDHLAERFGVDRGLWKRPEHAVKFGAGFAQESFEDALKAAKGRVAARISGEGGELNWEELHRLPCESREMAWERAVFNELPTMAQVAWDWAEDESVPYPDPEAVYALLRGVYEEMAQALDRWREWLLEAHWSQEGRPGGPHGYFVENPCDLPFSIHEERHGNGGEPSRYEQKVAYATSRLQGLEAAYMHAIAILAKEYEYEFLRNEHDGAVVIGEIPEEARERAREMSGFHRAELEEKPFGDKGNSTEGDRSVEGDRTRSGRDENDPPSPVSDRPPSSSSPLDGPRGGNAVEEGSSIDLSAPGKGQS